MGLNTISQFVLKMACHVAKCNKYHCNNIVMERGLWFMDHGS